MKRRIFLSFFISASALLAACLFLTMSILFSHLENARKQELASECLLAAQGVEKGGMAYLNGLKAGDFRMTLIAPDGTVIYDTLADAASMGSHGDRKEVVEAALTGVGDSERYSDTLLEKNIYYARRLSNLDIIRISVTYSSIWALLLGMLPSVSLIFIGTLILSLFLAGRISRRIVQPMNALDLDNPLENNSYEEISPLLNRIDHLHHDIAEQLQQLKQQQDEFSAVTDGMGEGLILLSNDSSILSINRAAAALFSTDQSCIGSSFTVICRNTAVQEILTSAVDGRRNESIIDISGRNYQISAAPVLTARKVTGICLLTFDVTEKLQSERIRREFTANVSHELKTPLHTIMGTAELLSNGLVNAEDIPHFTEMIMNEASRLVRLVNDIIRLSQLDEAADLPTEEVDLYSLAGEVMQTLETESQEKKVAFSLHGENAKVKGVRPLLYEIVYNLCDNAIRYNVPNGKADIHIINMHGRIQLKVCDTGIGIPPEHQARIFERFYRVDKGRSRSCGGTGLGLSIVKHAAEYHGAKIRLRSIVGSGTEITVTFPDCT